MFTLHNGDCLTVLPSIPSGSIDAIITDLPYGTTACKWDTVIEFVPMWKEVKRVLKPKGAFVTTSGQPFTSFLIASNVSMFKYCWVWNKKHGANFMQGNKRPINNYEDIVVFCDGQSTYNPQKTINPKGVEKRINYKYSKQKEVFVGQVSTTKEFTHYSEKYEADKLLPKAIIEFSRENKLHATQKPVALYEYLIKTYTNEGETVLDIAMGSGTTIEAAERTGRNSIGIEKDEGIFQSAVLRLKPFTPSNIACSGQGDSAAKSEFILP